MTDLIQILGIETNNLNNIDVCLIKNQINLIIGPSGSGKTSLAYDTIAQIGQHEYNIMFLDAIIEPNYKVNSYSNMKVTVPIKQNNFNTNMRSTIGTYFDINPKIAQIYSLALNQPYDLFILNKEGNVCSQCHGLGYIKILNINLIVDQDVKLLNCPFRCWSNHKDFYSQIIKSFCKENRINTEKTFDQLSSKEQDLLLYGESQNKYSIKFQRGNRVSTRTTKYYGVLTNIPMIPNLSISDKFFKRILCPKCEGKKFSKKNSKYIVNMFSVGRLMCTPFDNLVDWIESTKIMYHNNNAILFNLEFVKKFIIKANELNLNYLYLNRTIPTLSGGELQRLRLVQVFNTQLVDLLIVLDEPLASLSTEEKQIVYNNIIKLSNQHTLLIIDHHKLMYNNASKIIALGEGSGKYGGNLINTQEYISSQNLNFPYTPFKQSTLTKIEIKDKVYNYSGLNIQIANNRLNLLTGYSGVGKSTVLREYLSQYYSKYAYINQKPLSANINSTVATALDINNIIIEIFATQFKKSKNYFTNSRGHDGACPTCAGNGYIIIGNSYSEQMSSTCPNCDGSGFHSKLSSYKINNVSIIDIWQMLIDDAYLFFSDMGKKISNQLMAAKNILLGHLQLGQHISKLSGGENLRIKILKNFKIKTIVYGIDEPFKGLNNVEIYKLILFFAKLIDKDKTIIIADHVEDSFRYFSRKMTLSVKNNVLIAKEFI